MNNIEKAFNKVDSIGQFSKKYFTYLYETLKRIDEVEIDAKRGKHDHGFIAEEVEDILPKVVNYDMIDHEDESKGYRCESVNYGEITTYLVEVVKDLNNRIKVLEG